MLAYTNGSLYPAHLPREICHYAWGRSKRRRWADSSTVPLRTYLQRVLKRVLPLT